MFILVFGSSAQAVELPDSARALIPNAWSIEPELPAPAADWVVALGGDGLVELVRQSDRVAAVATADAAVSQARGQGLQAASGLLPSLSGSASWQAGTPSGAFAAINDSGSMEQYNAAANLSVPVSLWTSVPEQRAANADVRSAESSRADAQATAALDLTSGVLDLAQARENLAIVEEQLAVDQELLTLSEARYATGSVTGVDVLRQRQQVASTQADLPVARADVGRAERALAALLRVRVPDLPRLPDALPEPVLQPLPAPRELLSTQPAVQQALHDWEADRSRSRAARAGLLPELSLTASAGVRYTELIDTSVTPTWSAGVQTTVPLFDGGATFGRIRSASAVQTASLVALEQQVVDVVQSVEDALVLWQQASDVRRATDEAERMSVEAQQAAQAGYAAGTSTYNTVLDALKTVRTTRQAALRAQRDQVDAGLEIVSITRAAWLERTP